MGSLLPHTATSPSPPSTSPSNTPISTVFFFLSARRLLCFASSSVCLYHQSKKTHLCMSLRCSIEFPVPARLAKLLLKLQKLLKRVVLKAKPALLTLIGSVG